MLTHGSLFSGIGGFDLAAQWAGWKNIFQVEIDPWCQRILAKHFQNATRYTDIHDFDPNPYIGTIDIISGGFPCQPYSSAGKRKGKDDPRHLWPEMLRIIQTIKPRWVVGENVRGLVNWSGGLVFHEVQTNLESAGYEVQPFILPAASVNAPHARQRIWFIAHHTGEQMGNAGQSRQYGSMEPHPHSDSLYRRLSIQQWRQNKTHNAHTARMGEKNGHEIITHPYLCGLERRKKETPREIPTNRDNWNEWTTEPPICRMDDGISHRVDRIRGLGNAIVPQIALRIFDTINQYEAIQNS